MRKFILIPIMVTCVSISAVGQAKKESIKQLFSLMQQDSLINSSFAAMTSSIVSSMNLNLDSAANVRYAKILAKSMEASKQIARKLLNEDMVDIYDKYFSQQEIDDFIAFYRSPSGKKMIDRVPSIQKDVMIVMTKKYTSGLHDEIMKEITEIMKESSGDQ
jgi:hypothetical protein